MKSSTRGRFFLFTSSIRRLMVSICPIVDLPTLKPFWFFRSTFSTAMHQRFPVSVTETEFKQFYYFILSNRRPLINSRIDNETKERHFQILNKLRAKGYNTYMKILQIFEKHEEQDIHSEVVERVMDRYKCSYENKSCNFKEVFTTVYRHTSQSLCKQFNFYDKHKENGLFSTGNDLYNGLFMFWDISGHNYFNTHGLNGLLLEIHPFGTPHHLIDPIFLLWPRPLFRRWSYVFIIKFGATLLIFEIGI